MKKHLGWIVPLLGTVAAYVAAGLISSAVIASGLPEVQAALLALLVFFVWVVASIILLVCAGRNAHRIFRSYRRSAGHLTKSERAEEDLRQLYSAHWSAARHLTRQLAHNQQPPAQRMWGIVLEPGENVRLHISADYARYYGLNGQYIHTSGFFWGHPAFVLAGMGVTAMANSSRRRAAEAASREQWRELQHTEMLLTERRIICLANGRWLSFYYSAVTACYPEPQNNSLVLAFPSAEPLLIGGPQAPLAGAYLVWALYGQRGITDHPALEPLRS